MENRRGEYLIVEVNIEVGANDGSDTNKLSLDGLPLFAFEPSFNLYDKLKHRFINSPNIHILPFAVDIVNTIKPFYLQEEMEGLNSLYELNQNIINTPLVKYEIYHQPYTKTINVLTMRLDTFIIAYDITKIQYLWIDAQGNDFNCIKSLGSKLDIVKEGRCECDYKHHIYYRTDNQYEHIKAFLENRGFKTEVLFIHDEEPNIDIKFWKD